MVNQVHTHPEARIIECQCNAPLAPAPVYKHVPTPLAPEPVYKQVSKPHTHTTPDGTLVKCFHECRNQLRAPSFWVLTTLAFPIEHAIWTKLPLLAGVAKWAGL